MRGKLLYSNGALQESRPGWGRFVHRKASLFGKEVRGGGLKKDVRRVAEWIDV